MINNKIEILSPAGNLEKLKYAVNYGADAVYVGTAALSLRTRTDMEMDELEQIVNLAKSLNKKLTELFVNPKTTIVDSAKKKAKEEFQVRMLTGLSKDTWKLLDKFKQNPNNLSLVEKIQIYANLKSGSRQAGANIDTAFLVAAKTNVVGCELRSLENDIIICAR